MKVNLFLHEISDRYLRENFKRIIASFKEPINAAQFKFFEIDIPTLVLNYRFAHHLNFIPTDIIQTSLIGGSSLVWNYELFDSTYLDITTSGACTVRAFIGAYQEE